MDEFVVSGYCRQQDATRMVLCEEEAGGLQTDCCFPDCAYASECPIAAEIRARAED